MIETIIISCAAVFNGLAFLILYSRLGILLGTVSGAETVDSPPTFDGLLGRFHSADEIAMWNIIRALSAEEFDRVIQFRAAQ